MESSALCILWGSEIVILNPLKRNFLFCALLSFSLVIIYKDRVLHLLTDSLLIIIEVLLYQSRAGGPRFDFQ